MLSALLVSLGSRSSKWIEEEMRRLFDKVDHFNIKDIEVDLGGRKPNVLHKGEEIRTYDCKYFRGSYKYSNILRAMATINKNLFTPFGEEALTICNDKILTHMKLQQTSIPMPKTYLVSTTENCRNVLEKTHYPVVMKFPSGTHGKGVMLADSYESAVTMIDALNVLGQPFLIQEYIETGNTDTRALVVGNRVVASMRRKAKKGEKRANIHAGGTGEKITLDGEAERIAIRTAKVLGCSVCAVDLLESAKGPLVIEVNLSPGLQGITDITKINVAKHIAEHLYEQTRKKKEALKKGVLNEILEKPKQKEVITELDKRRGQIIIPEALTKITQLQDGDYVRMKLSKGKMEMEKYEE